MLGRQTCSDEMWRTMWVFIYVWCFPKMQVITSHTWTVTPGCWFLCVLLIQLNNVFMQIPGVQPVHRTRFRWDQAALNDSWKWCGYALGLNISDAQCVSCFDVLLNVLFFFLLRTQRNSGKRYSRYSRLHRWNYTTLILHILLHSNKMLLYGKIRPIL